MGAIQWRREGNKFISDRPIETSDFPLRIPIPNPSNATFIFAPARKEPMDLRLRIAARKDLCMERAKAYLVLEDPDASRAWAEEANLLLECLQALA